ncbi:glycoside hydrolase family protein [Flavobacterium algicola]|uniref:glycosyl hydrolase family 28-related protein n=1 Tax=Flavobacterium algicola TaxID=556529 RepID=UPI001EFD9C39|nr:glycosyl hydrolase family 28-related protein [Flavobacterium algicola]MCG9793701.1 hypothetical protein [Flavobacterium algicola]
MKLKNLVPTLCLFLFSVAITAQIDKESNFYKVVKNAGIQKNLVKDYKAVATFESNSTTKLQKSIDEVAKNGGGTIVLPKGNYLLSPVALKSDVHIKIDKDAVIRFVKEGKTSTVFLFGEKNEGTVKNVSVTCSDDKKKYTVDFENSGDDPALFQLGNVENFLISGFEVKDNFTKFSSIRLGISEYNGEYFYPTNGVVKNCSTINSHYGYGLVQSQAGRNLLFKDLSGIGGATLRLETGAKLVNDLQIGGNHDIVVRNISCKNGNSVVMLSPHAMKNGKVDIDGVYGESCGFTLRIENGFIATKYNVDDNIKVGGFENVVAKNIKAVYGVESQLKSKHFKFMPCELVSQLHLAPENMNRPAIADMPIYLGPSIGAVVDTDNYPTTISNVEAIGFVNKPILKEADVTNCGDAIAKITKGEKKVVKKDKSKGKKPLKDKMKTKVKKEKA